MKITDRRVVSYSGDDLCLTPEMEARLRAYWTDRLDRLTRRVLGVPERDDSRTFGGNVPEREQVPENPPFRGVVIPTGNT